MIIKPCEINIQQANIALWFYLRLTLLEKKLTQKHENLQLQSKKKKVKKKLGVLMVRLALDLNVL
jgi:hypothetical protein